MKRFLPLLMWASLALQAQQTPTLPLSLQKALELALAPEGNARVALAREAIVAGEARKRQALGYLLPNFDGNFSYQNFTRNLAAFGVQFNLPIPGLVLPEVVGPLDVLDFRATANFPFFDLPSLARYRASLATVQAIKADRGAAEQQTEGAVAKAYVNALRAEAAVDAARANVALAQRVLKLSHDQKEAGTGTGLDVTRAEVQVANESQRLVQAQEDRKVAVLQLLRVIGISMEGDVELTDRLRDESDTKPDTAQALATARAHRPEIEAESERTRVARLSYNAAKYESLPSAAAMGDYGTSGIAGEALVPTHTFGISVKVPVWDGGKRKARRVEALSNERQQEIRARDVAQQVELEVRTALAGLESAATQAKVAREALRLSEKELEQAQRRYEAGVTSSLELTDAQTQVARARESQVAALAHYNASRVDLDVAMGQRPSIAQ